MKISINIKNIVIYICFFFILLYPFNSTISTSIYKNNMVLLFSIIVPLVILMFINFRGKLSKKLILIFIITLILLAFVLYKNWYISYGNELKAIIFVIYLFVPFVLSINREWIGSFLKVVKIFLFEHMFFTYIALIFKDFYSNNILTFVARNSENCPAVGNFYHGYIPGLTTHFSTNAIYLSIAVLMFFAIYIYNRKKTNMMYFILALIALFTVGKRAHLIFSIVCCLVLYVYYKKEIKFSTIIKVICVLVIGVIFIVILSNYIPEVMNIITRFDSLIDSGDVLNGRDELYELAFKLWNRNIIFGNGWGAFSYYYQQTLYYFGSARYLDAHNVFLQLLCETGIIGATLFIGIMLTILLNSIKLLKSTDLVNNEKVALGFCVAYQLFFLMYCMTGNPLYDPQTYVIYFISIAIYLTLFLKYRRESVKNEKSRNSNNT